jgi:uncharacterized protein YjiS (DUF1127 family)
LLREQCFYCTEIYIGSFWLHQPDCTGRRENLAVNETRARLGKLRRWHRIAAGNKRRTEMSATLLSIFQPAVTVRPGRYTRRLFHAWARDIAHYFSRRAALRHLGELSDRELRDIGLTRGQVEAAVYGFMTRPDRARI